MYINLQLLKMHFVYSQAIFVTFLYFVYSALNIKKLWRDCSAFCVKITEPITLYWLVDGS